MVLEDIDRSELELVTPRQQRYDEIEEETEFE